MADPVPLQQPQKPSVLAVVGRGLWTRIVVSKGWTILGFVLGGAVGVFNEVVLPAMNTAPQPWLRAVAGIIAIAGAAKLNPVAVEAWAAKKQAEQDAKAAALKGIALLIGLSLATPTFAQGMASGDQVVPASPLSLAISSDLVLRPNLSVIAFGYDLTHSAYLGQGTLAGLYALTSRRLLDAGLVAGGSIAFDSKSKPVGSLLGGFVSPKLVLSPTVSLHGAALYAKRFGPDGADILYAAPTLEF